MSAIGAPRLVLAAASVCALVGMMAWSSRTGSIEGPARVEAAREFRVTHAGDGRVRWTVLDGLEPGGPVMVEDGLLQGERGDPVKVERVAGLVAGGELAQGSPVARVSAPGVEAELRALEAELALLDAEQALLQAGGRPESVARAARGVQVAEAALAQARSEASHLQGLVDRGAGAAWAVQEAEQAVSLRQAERSLALAEREEARLVARPEEIEAMKARRAAVEARLGAARTRVQGQELTAPFPGRLGLPGGEVLVAVTALGPSVLQVAVEEGRAAGIAPGDPVRFVPTRAAGAATSGQVVAVGDSAASLGGRPVIWVVARLEGELPVGATGVAHIQSGGDP